MKRPRTRLQHAGLVLSLAALAGGVTVVTGVAATAPADGPQWTDWKPSNDGQLEYRYRVHGSVMARLQLKSSASSGLMVRFKWICAPAEKFDPTVPEGYITVPAGGMSAEQTVGVQSCANPTPSSVELSSQPQ